MTGVLESVFGVVERAEHPVAVRVELRAVVLDEGAKRFLARGCGRLLAEPPVYDPGYSTSQPK